MRMWPILTFVDSSRPPCLGKLTLIRPAKQVLSRVEIMPG
jgi:hypothetical protein